MATTLTGFGGVGEIGGNAFLLDDGKSRIFLDFGKRFGAVSTKQDFQRRPGWGDYYDLLMRPRGGHQVHDLLAMDLLPPLPGLYRTDMGPLPKMHEGTAGLDAVLVSHPHSDHYGALGYLRQDTLAFMSPIAKLTLESVQKTGLSSPDDSFIRVKPADEDLPRTTKDRSADEVLEAMPERPIETGPTLEVGAWTVERHDVDHSIHGACGFILTHKDGLRVAYSGDLRLHGRHKQRTERFLRQAQEADVLMIEGTRAGGRSSHGHGSTHLHEADVGRTLEEALTSAKATRGRGFAAVAYPPRDLDRLVSVAEAARRSGRKLVITPKQAHLLWLLHGQGHVDEVMDPLRSSDLVVLVSDAERATQEAGKERKASGRGPWNVWTTDVADLDAALHKAGRTVTLEDVAADVRGHLVTMGSFTLNLLPGLLEPGHDQGVFLHSQTQPFNDEGVLRDFRLTRWLDRFGLHEVDAHVSGHLSHDDLMHALDESRSRTLVPIHTEHPDLSAKHYLAARPGGVVQLPTPGTRLPLR
jgi:ribonuclease J